MRFGSLGIAVCPVPVSIGSVDWCWSVRHPFQALGRGAVRQPRHLLIRDPGVVGHLDGEVPVPRRMIRLVKTWVITQAGGAPMVI